MIWIAFFGLVLALVLLDLGIFHRRDEEISFKNSLIWTGVWIGLSLLFNGFIYYLYQYNPFHFLPIEPQGNTPGLTAAITFFTGYIIEKSLSLDNVFVFALIFGYFNIPMKYQHKILFWGILSAVILRGVLISAGVLIIDKFEMITVIFGIFILYTAAKMMVEKQDDFQPENNVIIRFFKKRNLVYSGDHNGKFFMKVNGKTLVTTLFLALIMVEISDVAFAVDSIPAIFAVTQDPFIILTSNVFAILGLRSLYFVLAASLKEMRYLKHSLIFILVFIGVKMGISPLYHIPIVVTLMFILGTLVTGVVASIMAKPDFESEIPKTELNTQNYDSPKEKTNWGKPLLLVVIFFILGLVGLIIAKSGNLGLWLN